MNHTDAGKPIDILLVEDNLGDVWLTKQALKRTKIKSTPHVVMDGEEALLYLKKQKKHVHAKTPDLIFLDLNLPKKDGLSVLDEIKKDSHLKLIPTIMFSASAADKDITKTYAHHANCYIIKPTDFTQFMDVVKSIEEFWYRVATLPEHDKK